MACRGMTISGSVTLAGDLTCSSLQAPIIGPPYIDPGIYQATSIPVFAIPFSTNATSISAMTLIINLKYTAGSTVSSYQGYINRYTDNQSKGITYTRGAALTWTTIALQASGLNSNFSTGVILQPYTPSGSSGNGYVVLISSIIGVALTGNINLTITS